MRMVHDDATGDTVICVVSFFVQRDLYLMTEKLEPYLCSNSLSSPSTTTPFASRGCAPVVVLPVFGGEPVVALSCNLVSEVGEKDV
jgi:hypothetical protein